MLRKVPQLLLDGSWNPYMLSTEECGVVEKVGYIPSQSVSFLSVGTFILAR